MPCRVPKRRFSCGAPQHLTKNLKNGAGDRNRTGTDISIRRILSPLRLPVPPPRHDVKEN